MWTEQQTKDLFLASMGQGFLDLRDFGLRKNELQSKLQDEWFAICKKFNRPYIVIAQRGKRRSGFDVHYDCITTWPPFSFTDEDTRKFLTLWKEAIGRIYRNGNGPICTASNDCGEFQGLLSEDAEHIATYCSRTWSANFVWAHEDTFRKVTNGMIKLFKDGHAMAIQTDATNEKDFRDQFADTLAELIEKEIYKNDWQFQLRFWLGSFVEISCKLRGYKAEVREIHLLTAGTINPADSALVASFSNAGLEVMAPKIDFVDDQPGG